MTPSLPGRVSLRRVQASGFLDGLLVDPAHGIDQLWIDECLFGANTQDGVHIVPGSGTALIDIQRSNTNNNGRHGINIFTSSVIGHINIRHPESVGNGGDSCRIEGSGTNTIISVLLENPDFEGVVTGSGSNSAFHAIYVWKLLLLIGQYSAKASNTAFSGIWLENCAEAEVVMPWIRRIADGQGTCTNELYVSGASTKKVRGRGLSYFGTDLNFTVDAATVPAGAVINMDSKTPPEIRAAAEGLVAQSFERVLMQSNTALVTQRAQVASVPVKANQKISTVYFGNSIAGTSVTLARVGIWNSAKALVASCVSDVTLVTSTGLRTATLTTPYTMPADGVLYVGVLAAIHRDSPLTFKAGDRGDSLCDWERHLAVLLAVRIGRLA